MCKMALIITFGFVFVHITYVVNESQSHEFQSIAYIDAMHSNLFTILCSNYRFSNLIVWFYKAREKKMENSIKISIILKMVCGHGCDVIYGAIHRYWWRFYSFFHISLYLYQEIDHAHHNPHPLTLTLAGCLFQLSKF